MCPHTTKCVLIPLYMCPQTTVYVSSFYYIYVLIGVLIPLYVSSYHYIRVLILLYMCPHSTIYCSRTHFDLFGVEWRLRCSSHFTAHFTTHFSYCSEHTLTFLGGGDRMRALPSLKCNGGRAELPLSPAACSASALSPLRALPSLKCVQGRVPCPE